MTTNKNTGNAAGNWRDLLTTVVSRLVGRPAASPIPVLVPLDSRMRNEQAVQYLAQWGSVTTRR